MFNDNYDYDDSSTKESNNSGKNLKLILIIAAIFIVFIIILLIINSATKTKTSPTPTPSAPTIIDNGDDDDDNEYEPGDQDPESPEEKRVGSPEYGYITIPGNWEDYKDTASNTSLQYTDGSYIITLKAVKATESNALAYATAVKQSFINDGVDTTGATVSLGKYKAYQVWGYYTGVQKWCVCWIFEAEDDKTHYISVEGPEKTSVFKIPETFSIVR